MPSPMIKPEIALDPRREDFDGRITLVHRAPAEMKHPQLGGSIRASFDLVYGRLKEAQALPQGHNVVVYGPCDKPGWKTLDCGVIQEGKTGPFAGITSASLPAGSVLRLTHLGPYEELRGSWDRVLDWAKTKALSLKGLSWEEYGDWTDKASELRTDIFILLA